MSKTTIGKDDIVLYGGRGGGKMGNYADRCMLEWFQAQGFKGMKLHVMYRAYLRHKWGIVPNWSRCWYRQLGWRMLDFWFDLRFRKRGGPRMVELTQWCEDTGSKMEWRIPTNERYDWLEINTPNGSTIKVALPRMLRDDWQSIG